jgi:uncharacterized phage protein (TIGR01671 family)
MRAIKFRAWDKVNKKMFEPTSVSWGNGVLWVCDSHGDNRLEYELVRPNDGLMQFTGLHDKNGKEIYYNDICFDYFLKMKFVVEEITVAHWIIDIDKMNCPMDSVEVIGNIYENPNPNN